MFYEQTHLRESRGWIEVICGPMFSGKTEELIRRLKRARIANQEVAVFKPALDNRYSQEEIVSHDSNSLTSYVIEKAEEILQSPAAKAHVIGIEEAQFFSPTLVRVAQMLADKGKRVVICGLDMDYLGRPFSPMPDLMAIAKYVTKLHAICMQCGNLATHSYRTIAKDDKVLVGEKESYEPRCRYCFNQGQQEKGEVEQTQQKAS